VYESFGAVVDGDAVEFRLFVPDAAIDAGQYERGGPARIAEVRVVGDFQDRPWDSASAPALPPSEHPAGRLFTHRVRGLAEGLYEYKYLVGFENGTSRWCTDPCTRYVGRANENAGFVIGGQRLAVRPLADPRPQEELVIYELMLDDFTHAFRGERAPVDAVLVQLDHVLAVGVNTVQLMPWTAWRGGAFSWGYDPFLFFAVEDRYIADPAQPSDRVVRLKRLVDTLHERGVGVIMDGVFNHVSAGVTPDSGFPYHWLWQDPEDSPFTGEFSRGGFFEDLDFTNACTQQFVGDVCRFWLDEYQLDGIRFDYTRGFHPVEGERGIRRLVAEVRKHLAAQGRSAVLILEHLPDNRYEAVNDTNVIGADACWFDPLMFELGACAASGRAFASLMRALDCGRDFAVGKGPVTYAENHDHSTLASRVGGRSVWYRMQPAAIALMTAPGAVMLHNGQEFGDDWWLPESGEGRVVSRPVNWPLAADGVGESLIGLYRRLAEIRRAHPALRTHNFYPRGYDARHTSFNPEGYGVDTDRGLAIYHRWGTGDDRSVERVTIALNFSASDQWVDVPLAVNGMWDEVIDGGRYEVRDWRVAGHRLPSHWGHVFVHRS
jgi:pullulanase